MITIMINENAKSLNSIHVIVQIARKSVREREKETQKYNHNFTLLLYIQRKNVEYFQIQQIDFSHVIVCWFAMSPSGRKWSI